VIEMMWFKYVWIVILVIIWIIWTISAIIDFTYFLDDIKKDRWEDSEFGVNVATWLIIHFLIIFVSSIIYFFLS